MKTSYIKAVFSQQAESYRKIPGVTIIIQYCSVRLNSASKNVAVSQHAPNEESEPEAAKLDFSFIMYTCASLTVGVFFGGFFLKCLQ